MRYFISFILCFVTTLSICAQTTTTDSTKHQQYVITKNDGAQYIGIILSDDGREVLLETSNLGKIYITKSDIKSIVEITDETGFVNDNYVPTGPFTTRYSFTTNALPIKKGENYAMVSLYGPEVHFALSNRLSIGVMSTWIGSPFVLATKYSIPTKNEKLNISLGALVGSSGYLLSGSGFGGLYFANFTYGDRKNNVTLGVGYAHFNSKRVEPVLKPEYANYADTIISDDSPYMFAFESQEKPMRKGPVLSFAGITRVSAKASLFVDCIVAMYHREIYELHNTTIQYLPNSPDIYYLETKTYKTLSAIVIFMPGMRFQKTDRMAFQFSLTGIHYTRIDYGHKYENTFPFPMISWFFKM